MWLPHQLVAALGRSSSHDVLHNTVNLDPLTREHVEDCAKGAGCRLMNLAVRLWRDWCPCNLDRTESIEVTSLNFTRRPRRLAENSTSFSWSRGRSERRLEVLPRVIRFPRLENQPWNLLALQRHSWDSEGHWPARKMAQRTSNFERELLKYIVQSGVPISPLFRARWLTHTCFRIDWLHCADMGVSIVGGAFWHVVKSPSYLPGQSRNARVHELWTRSGTP